VSVEPLSIDCNDELPGLCPNRLLNSAASCAASVFDCELEFEFEFVVELVLEPASVDVSEPAVVPVPALAPLLELAP
jgi:hypothetical protein